jgi:hypothetical protein
MNRLSEEYGNDEGNRGFSREEIRSFMNSYTMVLEARRDS